jgi:hypothetical protein
VVLSVAAGLSACGVESVTATSGTTAAPGRPVTSTTPDPTRSGDPCQLGASEVQPVAADAPLAGRLVARLQNFAGFSDLPGALTELAVYDTGDVVTLGQEYHRARLAADGMAAIKACADAVGFSSLEASYPQGRPTPGDPSCMVADAATTEVLAPTGVGPKVVSAYGISLTGTMKCDAFPPALTRTYDMLEQVADQSARTGSRWNPDSVQIERWPATGEGSGLVLTWPPIPVPATGATSDPHGADAGALLDALQFPATPGTAPRYFQPGGLRTVRLPDGSLARIAFLVVLPGDDGLPQTGA